MKASILLPVSIYFDKCLGKGLVLNKSYKPIGTKMFYQRVQDGKVFAHWVKDDTDWYQEMKLVDPRLVGVGA